MSALADALRAWVLQKTASRELASAVGLALDAETEGHACVRLSLDGSGLDLALREQPWVGDGTSESITPCVLTDRGDFYLWRNWRHEQRLAEALMARVDRVAADPMAAASGGADLLDPALLTADIELLYAGMDVKASRGQREAVAAAVGRRLFVLCGGPGTGKTTTVLRLLLCWLRQRGPDFRIALAAPTGKAAQRLSQSMREGKAELATALTRAGLLEQPAATSRGGESASDSESAHAPASARNSWSEVLARLPEAAQTVHRLLGAQPTEDRFRHDAEQPLPHQLVVVDEASMVDLALMRALIESLAPTAALLLVGDPDQLVSVSAGSVLADLVQVAQEQGSVLAAHTARLQHVWRAEQELAHAFELARRGEADALASQLVSMDDCAWHPVEQLSDLSERLAAWLRRPEWDDLLGLSSNAAHAARAFDQLRALQLLSALREGHWGAIELASRIDQALRERAGGSGRWYPGRAIVVSHNDYARRLYNGDIGIALGQGEQLRVHFQSTDSHGQAVLRSLSPRELPAHDLAFALSVHKSQGSEYDHVAVLLPPDPEHRILTRQLLYTALSRARFGVELWSSEASLRSALARRSQRHGGLRERLGQARVTK